MGLYSRFDVIVSVGGDTYRGYCREVAVWEPMGLPSASVSDCSLGDEIDS